MLLKDWQVELLRGILMLAIFFALYLPVQYYILDPWRGVEPPPPLEDLLDRVCPPGTDCNHGDLKLSSIKRP